jgi:hypothetical protein
MQVEADGQAVVSGLSQRAAVQFGQRCEPLRQAADDRQREGQSQP